jgi:pimeloyl-ACP methyl ester carboxylesterase
MNEEEPTPRASASVGVLTRLGDPAAPQPPAPPLAAAVYAPALPAQPQWTRERIVDPTPDGAVVARLAGCAVVGAAILMLGAVSVLVLLGTYAPDLLARHAPGAEVGRLLLAVLVGAFVAAAIWRGRRSLVAAAHVTGTPTLDAFLDSSPSPDAPDGDPGEAPETASAPTEAATPAIAPMRRSVAAAAGLGAAGAGLVLAGQGVMTVATVPLAVRLGAAIVIAGSLAVVAGAALLPAILRGGDRRLADADRRRHPGAVRVPRARSALVLSLVAVLVAAGGGLAYGLSGPGTSPAACDVDPGWTCGIVRVPADRRAADPGAELVEMAYAVHPATNPVPGGPRRVLVIAVGGPGVPGLPEAGWLYRLLGDRVRERFEVVVYDPRGTGLTDPRDCPDAAEAYYDGVGVLTRGHVEGFATRCLAESGVDAADARRYGTDEVVEDLDALRHVLGVERFALYGASYGTVVAQAYAAAHPDRLDSLVLDAPVDRALPAATAWTRAALGFERALSRTLGSCTDDPDCHDALPEPTRTWERLLDAVDNGQRLPAEVIDGDGVSFAAWLDEDGLWTLANAAMYDTTARASFLRALAQYDGGNVDGLARLWWAWSGEGTSSSFAYYATWCADARVSPTARTDDFDAYIRVARDAGVHGLGFESVAHAIAPCLYWPSQPPRFDSPAEASTVPTLILGATGDPVTPIEEARSILDRHAEARLVETRGGAHGSLGDTCPTDRMTEFLVDGTLPVARTSVCIGSVADAFLPLAPTPVRTAQDAAEGIYWELFADPLVIDWPGDETLVIGCGTAGTATFEPVDDQWQSTVILERCTYASGVALTGSGTLDLDDWDAELRLSTARGSINLDGNGSRWHVDGTWDGNPVEIDE